MGFLITATKAGAPSPNGLCPGQQARWNREVSPGRLALGAGEASLEEMGILRSRGLVCSRAR